MRYDVRVVMMTMGNMITQGDDDMPEGFAAPLCLEIFSWYHNWFNYTFVWVPRSDKTMMGYRKPDGTYTGILRLLAEDEADMSLYPLPIVPETEVFDLGPSVVSFPILISTVMDLRSNPDNVLTQLFRFSAEIIVLLVVSVYALSFVLTKSEKSRSVSIQEQREMQKTDTKFLGSLWYMVELMAMQATYEPKTLPGKLLIVVTSIAVLFWYTIWGNLMTSDTVSYDGSRVVSNLDDIVRLNTSMYMIASDPAARMMELDAEYNPDNIIGTVLNQHTTVYHQESVKGGQMGMLSMRKEIEKLNDTFFLNKGVMTLSPIVDQFQGVLCQYRQSNPTKWNHNLQVSTDARLPYSPFSPWYGKRLDRNVAHKTTGCIRRVSESGLLQEIYKQTTLIAAQVLEISEPGSCIVWNADRFIQDLMMSTDDIGIRVSIERVSDVFQLYCACMAMCLFVFVVEKTGVCDSFAGKYRISMEEIQRLREERRMNKRQAKLEKMVERAKKSAIISTVNGIASKIRKLQRSA